MNPLARVKLSNNYDIIIDSLERETGSEPITDIDGATALLLSDGTSWEYIDGEWKQIEIQEDFIIMNSLYSFIASVCNSINNNFTHCGLSALYQNATMSKENGIVTISGLLAPPKIQVGDFIIVKDYVNEYLSTVSSKTDSTISFDDTGLDVRISGSPETVGVYFVSFPPQFIDAVLSMLGYDLFQREGKEKRQERLGNYTYTSFEPSQYCGLGSYPTRLENIIKNWEKIII